jgi:hypothetical protein
MGNRKPEVRIACLAILALALSALALAAPAARAGAQQTNQPSPQYGIAARYPNDLGLEKDPDVLLFEDYELADVEDLRKRGWDWNRGHVGVWGLTDEPAHVFAGRKSLVQHMIQGREGSIMPRDLKPPEDGPVYHRVYLYFPKDAPTTRVMGITGVRDGWPTWRAIGSAGWKPTGDNYYCATLIFDNNHGKVRASWYPYHVDQKAQWGSNWWVSADIPTDRWFCLEIMTRLTTPGKIAGSQDSYRDGELRMWIDGKGVYHRTDLRWRTDSIVKTTMVFAQCYSSQPFKTEGVYYADNRVVARKYIGPMVTEKREPTDFSVSGAPSDAPPAARGETAGPGIASRYPNDVGIEKDAAVLLAEDFEVPDLAALRARGWTPYHGPGLWVDGSQEQKGWSDYAIDASPGAARAGTRCLKKTIQPDQWGGRMIRDLAQPEDCLYYRACLKLDNDFPNSVDAALRLMGVAGVRDGQPTYQTYGAQTPRSDGSGPFWLDLMLHNWIKDGQVVWRYLALDSKQTDQYYEVSAAGDQLPLGRWFSLEMKVKLNTPGKRKGELRVWIDDKEVLTCTQAFFRSTDRVHIRSVLDQARLDSHLHFKTAGHVWVDNLVVARQYIGPMTRNTRP